MSISAGRLIQALTIQNFTTTRSPSGQPIESWSDGETIRADIQGISGRELIRSGAELAEATVRVYVRGESAGSISAASRLKVLTGPYKNQVLNVAGPPIPDKKGSRIEILCKQGVKK